MTIHARRDLWTLLQAVRDLIAECDKQGQDSTGYHHYIDAFKVDQVRIPLALVLRHLQAEGKKHGDFRYMERLYDAHAGTKTTVQNDDAHDGSSL